MNLFQIFTINKKEALKTDEVRRKAHVDIAKTKGALDDKYAHLSALLEDALVELSAQKEPAPHPKKREQ